MELCNLNSKYDDVNLMLGLEQAEGSVDAVCFV